MYICTAVSDFDTIADVDVQVIVKFPYIVTGPTVEGNMAEVKLKSLSDVAKWASWRCSGFFENWKILEYDENGKYLAEHTAKTLSLSYADLEELDFEIADELY